MHIPELAKLRYFVAVAETLNFRKAAENLNVAQPAITRAIQALERDLGLALLSRTTRRVRLTEAGAVLAADARQALGLLERSVRQARQLADGKAGEIVVAYSAQAQHGPMAELVVRFKNENPSATVSLYQMSSHEQIQAIERGEVDVGFMLSAACKSSLSQLRVCRERFVVLLSSQHPLANSGTISLRAIRDAPFVMGTSKRWEAFRSLVNSACVQAGFLPVVVDEADDVPVLLQLVALQRGITLYGAAISPMLPSQLAAVPVSDPHAAFDIVVAWDGRRNAPLVDKLVGFLRAALDETEGKKAPVAEAKP